MKPGRHVEHVVVGAGAAGACVAYELSRRSAEVLVLDAGGDVGAGCSWANAGLLSPAHVEPLATPANVTLGLRYLLQPDSPFHIQPAPRLAPWLVRFAAAASPRRAAAATAELRDLAHASLALHHDYVAAGLPTGLRSSGSLDVFLHERTVARRRTVTSPSRVLSPGETRALEPSLGPVAGAVAHPEDAMLESQAFVRAVLGGALAHGAEVCWRSSVQALRPHRAGVEVDLGDRALTCSNVVLAAGVDTRKLARQAGIRAPLEAGMGYVVDLPPAPDLTRPVTFKELKIVATPYPDRLRLSGTMDLGAPAHRVDPRRVAPLLAAAARGFPGLSTTGQIQEWAGARPCTPDGVPMLGRSRRTPEVSLATGHGMWGVILGPITGHLLAAHLLDEHGPTISGTFDPDRFTSRWRPRGPAASAEPSVA